MSPKEEGTSTLINADGDVSAVNISFAGEHLDSTKKMDVSELQTISSPPLIEAQQPATVIPIEKDGMLNLQSTNKLPRHAILAASPLNGQPPKRDVETAELSNRKRLSFT